MNGIAFTCPDCQEHVALVAMYLGTDGKIYFLGECEDCETQLSFELETLLARLYGGQCGNRVH